MNAVGTTYALAALMLHEASFLQRELNKQQQHNIRDEKKQVRHQVIATAARSRFDLP